MEKAKPKVLQVNKLYHPWIGGVEKVVQNIAEGLKDEVSMKVLACQSKGFGEARTINGVDVLKTTSFGVAWGMPLSLTFPLILVKEIRNHDVLHFHLPFPLAVLGYLLSPVRGKKVVVTYHSDIVRQKRLMGLYRPLLDRFLDTADLILPTSPNLVENSPFLRNREEKCRVVPLSIDIEEFTNFSSEEGEFPVEVGEDKVVLFVGRLSYYKGVDILLEAMKEIDARLLIVGEGELKGDLQEKCRSLSLEGRVDFLGEVSDEALKRCYQIADVFVLPSVERSEAFGLVQLEAMAYGTPVVNTDLPTGVPYVSRDGETGLTVQPGDSEELSAAINTLLTNEEMAEEFGRNARERVKEKFTRERMLSSILDVYRELSG